MHLKSVKNFVPLFIIFFGLPFFEGNAKAQDLKISEQWSIPLTEISGLGLQDKSLFLASDNSRNILRIPLDGDAISSLQPKKAGDLKVREKNGIKLSKKSQWEALALDKAGSLFAVKESEDQIFQFTNDGRGTRSYQLAGFDGRLHKNKGYEGLLLLKKSHMLLALSKAPVLVEFGPKGDAALGLTQESLLAGTEEFKEPSSDELVPLAHWALNAPGTCQLSDLALDRDGKALALLKDCPLIIRIPWLEPSKNVFTPEKTWLYPSELVHAEGLVSVAPDGFLVALDQKNERNNLFWLQAKTPEPAPKAKADEKAKARP